MSNCVISIGEDLVIKATFYEEVLTEGQGLASYHILDQLPTESTRRGKKMFREGGEVEVALRTG